MTRLPQSRGTPAPDRIVYDNQADVFEARAGLPDAVAQQVAHAVLSYAGVAFGDLVVEVGAGTGVIGQWLARHPGPYLGFDSSQAMLDVFVPRLRSHPDATVVRADAEQAWPVPDGSAAVVFGSRVLHLLRADHVIGEARRVAHPKGVALVCGFIEHSPDSPRAMARRKLRELLAQRGLRPRPSGGRPKDLFATAATVGAELLAPQVAATWPETIRVTQVIDWWRGKTSVGGINPPAEVAEAVLDALDAWGSETFGQPAASVTTHVTYVLEGVRLSSTHKGVMG